MSEEDAVQIEVEAISSNTLLERIREGLQTDESVYFAGEIVHPNYGGYWLEAVDVIVAPKEPIFNADKLNDFMDDLVPDLPRSARDEARKHDKESDFALGKLYFDEVIGETTREIEVTTTAVDTEALQRSGVNIGKSHETKVQQLQRRTWVRVYPSAEAAQIVAEYEKGIADGTVEPNQEFGYMQHWFSAEQFEQIKKAGKKPFRRMLKLPLGRK